MFLVDWIDRDGGRLLADHDTEADARHHLAIVQQAGARHAVVYEQAWESDRA